MTTYLNHICFSLGVIVILLEVASVNADSKICQRRNGNFLQAGSFCQAYYECKDWVPVEKICPRGYNFNVNSESCEWKGLYRCPEIIPQQERFTCPHNWGEYPNIHRCSMYWWCLGPEPLVVRCPPFQLFDKVDRICKSEIDAVCADETDVVEPGYRCAIIVGTFTFQKDCSKYYECMLSVPTLRTCKRDNLFDGKRCAPKEMVHCGSRFNPYDLLTSEKVKSTVIFTSSTPSDDQNKKTTIIETYPPMSTNKPSTAGFTYSTLDPDFERTNSKDLETTVPSTVATSSVPSTTNVDVERTNSDDLVTSTKRIPDSTPVKTEETELPTSQTVTDYITSTKRITARDTTLREKVTFTPEIVEVTTSIEQNVICPKPYGHFRHPTDEHKFIACDNNLPYIFDCPANLVYNEEDKRCDYKYV